MVTLLNDHQRLETTQRTLTTTVHTRFVEVRIDKLSLTLNIGLFYIELTTGDIKEASYMYCNN